MKDMRLRNQKLADSFYDFCLMNPELRFWQALRTWSGHNFVLVANEKVFPDDYADNITYKGLTDTFYWEGKDN